MSHPKKLRVTGDGCVHDNDVIYLRSKPKMKKRVQTHWGVIERVMVLIDARGRAMLADVITGTLYDPQTGRCNTPDLQMLVVSK